jgi:hypothetical protein
MSARQKDPRAILEEGAKLLRPVLEHHGFAFVAGDSGASSGGLFASGEFVRGDRRLELHVRHGLGLVRYHVGEATLDHESYLRDGGHWSKRSYPDFSSDPIQGFVALAKDLAAFFPDFLGGDGRAFRALAAEQARDTGRFKGFQALGNEGG